jgi:hypothetical protein
VKAGRVVTAWRRGDLDRRAVRRLQVRALPGLEAARGAAEALGAGGRGDDRPRVRQQRATRGVEVVLVLVVREQHRVDPADLGGGDRRACHLA